MTEKWPHIQEQMINKKVDTQMQLLMDAIITIRNIRASWNINPSVKVNAVIKAKKKEAQLLMGAQVYIKNLARVETITIEEAAKKPPKSAAGVIGDMEIYIPLEGIIDLKGEKERLEKKIEELSGVIKGMDSRLKNKNFTSKAPTEIVEKEKTRKLECADTLKRLKDNLKDLG
jgi:valyl-tRNA synthetase